MKLLRISSVPDRQLKKINLEWPTISHENYDSELGTYFENFFAISDAIIYELNKTNKCVAKEVIINHTYLQKLWLKENKFDENTTALDTIKLQIQEFSPDVIFVNTNFVSEEFLRKNTKGGTFLIAWDGFVKPLLNFNSKYDLILTCLDSISNKYKKIGTKSKVLDLAFDERILKLIGSKKNEKLNFVGNITYVHHSRQSLIQSLLDADVDFSLYLGNMDCGINPFSRTILREIIQNKRINNVWNIYNLQKQNKGQKYGLDMYNTIHQSYSTLNFHGDAVDKACNMRLFEATGLGTCLITDNKPGLDKFFDIDNEVIVYQNENDLVDKVKYLQKNQNIAEKIGRAGQEKILSKHLWSHRILELLQIIDEFI